MQHGTHYRGQRLRGWWMSEKLDGCRAYWDGEAMWSRGGTRVALPSKLRRSLPAGVPLDGEVYGGPDTLAAARHAVVHGVWAAGLRFHIFDAPTAAGAWPLRLAAAAALMPARSPLVALVTAARCEGERHAARILGEVHARGGEGLMLRALALSYSAGRTRDLVKLKRPYYATFLGTR